MPYELGAPQGRAEVPEVFNRVMEYTFRGLGERWSQAGHFITVPGQDGRPAQRVLTFLWVDNSSISRAR